MPLVCAVLAAGSASRFGAEKLLETIGETTLLQRALDAAADFPTVVVLAPSLAPHVQPREGLTIVINAAPEQGMSRSLQLGDALVSPDDAIAVLLADMPFVDRAHVHAVAAAYDNSVDVVDPRSGDAPGHPVIFGPNARRRLGALPPGDTLRLLRAAGDLRRRVIELPGSTLVVDVDARGDLEKARRLALGTDPAGKEL